MHQLAVPSFLYSALIEYTRIDVSAIVWPLKTISGLVDFWATVCETSPYAIGPLSVLSVCNVGIVAKRLDGSR